MNYVVFENFENITYASYLPQNPWYNNSFLYSTKNWV